MNPFAALTCHEADGRETKALKLADHISGLSWAKATPDLAEWVAIQHPDWWLARAEDAGTNPPSTKTQVRVVEILAAREKARANALADPFEGVRERDLVDPQAVRR